MRYLLLTALIASALPGQPRPAGPPRQGAAPRKEYKPEELCTVSGFVRNSSTGEPLSKATVSLSAQDRRNYSAASDPAGAFTIRGIEPGQYRIHASRNGYVSSDQSGRRSVSPGALLTLATSQVLKDVDVKLLPHAVVTGRVFDNDGEPVVHANVQLMRYRYNQRGKRQLVSSGGAQTNDLGEYRVFGLPSGKYYVAVTPPGRGGMSINDGGPGGEAVNESPISTYYPGAAEPGQATMLDISTGANLQGIDVRVLRARTFRVSGQVVGGPAGRRQGMVMLLPPDREDVGASFGGPLGGAGGPNGKFAIRGVLPGRYTILAEAFDGNQRLRGTGEVVVGQRNVDDAQVVLQPSFEMTGTIRLEGQDTADFSNVFINVEPRERLGRVGGSDGRTEAGGKFVLRQVIAGHYDLLVNGLPQDHFVKSVRVGEADALAEGARMQPGMSLDIVVSPNGGRLSGGVTNEKGDVVTSASVVLLAPGAPVMRRIKTASVDQQGQFSLTGIAPGDYHLFAVEDGDAGVYWEPDFLKKNEKLIEKISIRESATESKTLKLIPAGG